MIEGGRGQRFGAQPRRGPGQLQPAIFEHFDGNGAIELEVDRLVDDAHAADTETGNDAVPPGNDVRQRTRGRVYNVISHDESLRSASVCHEFPAPGRFMITPMRRWLVCLTVAGAACVSNLPEQDLRILAAQPSAKLSASDLWKDFQTDATKAKATYFGKAIDVSDKPTAIETQAAKGQHLFFAQAADHGVRARLLDEKATETLKDVKVGERLTLRCFCQGTDAAGDVVLKSCIKP